MGEGDGDPSAPDGAGLVDAFESLQQEWMRTAVQVTEQLAGALGSTDGSTSEDNPAASGNASAQEMARLYAPLLRAQAAWLEGGLRYMGRLSQAHGAHLPEMYRRIAEAPAEGLDERGRRELNDEVRAYLRQLADVSVQEARVLQHKLAELELGIREPVGKDLPDTPRRLVRAKD